MNQILSILGSIGFNWHVALANFINFLIILFLLNKFFFGKIAKIIENRKATIERGLSQAADAERALSNANEEKHILLSMAEKEGHNIIQEATEHAKRAALSIQSGAEKEISARRHELELKEKNMEEDVERSFAKRAPELVAKLYTAALSKDMTKDENNALIARIAS